MPNHSSERRHEPRVSTVNLVNVAEFTDVGFRTDLEIGRTLDLSHDGIRIELSHPLPLRTIVTLDVQLGERILELHGKVRSVVEIDERTCDMGIEFVDVTPEEYELLDEFLKLRAPEGVDV